MKNAGFDIIAQEVYYDDECKFGYAVGEKDNKYMPDGKEYVTWEFREENGVRDYYWGHYYSNRDTAFRDYHERLYKEYKEE